MGVQLTELVPVRPIELADLAGKKVAVDAFNTIYQFLSSIRDKMTGEPLRDSNGRVTSHLSGLFYRTARLLEARVQPIFVFDGEPPAFKRATQEARGRVRAAAEVRWKEALAAGDVEAARTAAAGSSRLTAEMIAEGKELLSALGVRWLQAPSEGEAAAAQLVLAGEAWAAGSQDWDSLLFGVPRLVRNLTISGRRKLPKKQLTVEVRPELVVLEEVLQSIGLTREQLVLVALLVGTDYNPGGVKGYGPKKALKLVQEERSLEAVLAKVPWEHEARPEAIVDFFLHPPQLPPLQGRGPAGTGALAPAALEPEQVRALLVDRHGFALERVDSVLGKLATAKANAQKGLGAFLK
ncbi:MAG TPA: flap endonuclease-1 [archaeon]|nr:flap endonuclease-1 [archaeon]